MVWPPAAREKWARAHSFRAAMAPYAKPRRLVKLPEFHSVTQGIRVSVESDTSRSNPRPVATLRVAYTVKIQRGTEGPIRLAMGDHDGTSRRRGAGPVSVASSLFSTWHHSRHDGCVLTTPREKCTAPIKCTVRRPGFRRDESRVHPGLPTR